MNKRIIIPGLVISLFFFVVGVAGADYLANYELEINSYSNGYISSVGSASRTSSVCLGPNTWHDTRGDSYQKWVVDSWVSAGTSKNPSHWFDTAYTVDATCLNPDGKQLAEIYLTPFTKNVVYTIYPTGLHGAFFTLRNPPDKDINEWNHDAFEVGLSAYPKTWTVTGQFDGP